MLFRSDFGESIGIAFQLSDDLLDIESNVSGKTPGTDLREGIKTLPVLLALADPDTPAWLRELLSGPLPDYEQHARALMGMREHPAMDQARAVLAQWTDRARSQLDALPVGQAKLALTALCDSVEHRAV